MYLIISSLLFTLNSQSTQLQSNITSSKNYHLHINEDKILMQFPNVIDAQLYTNNTYPYCQLIQKNISILIKQLPILENHEIYENFDNQVYPLNLKQFICMTQIQDGIIVLTTNYIIYFFQFNYDVIESKNANKFANMIWTADFKQIISDKEFEIQFTQIVFCVSTNQVLIIFSSSAYLLTLQKDNINQQSTDVISVGDWVQRSSRGLTKSIDDIIFTCVGQNGIDIYRLAYNTLRYIGNIDKKNLQLQQFNLKDFALFRIKDFNYKCYFLDLNGNVQIIEIQISNFDFKFQLLATINSKGQGIAVDTKNGLNVFVAYQVSHFYQVVEYYISLNKSFNIELNSYKTRSQIKNLDATDEFVIIQGNNHHKILFRSDIYQQQLNKLPVFTYLGLRDFEIFQLHSVTKQFQKQFEIFIGITSTNLFLVKIQIQPYSIRCYTQQEDLSRTQFYQFFANSTTFIELDDYVDRIDTQATYNFTIQLIDSVDLGFQIQTFQIVIIIIIFLLMSIFCYWVHVQKRKINVLQKYISMAQRRKYSIIQTQ